MKDIFDMLYKEIFYNHIFLIKFIIIFFLIIWIIKILSFNRLNNNANISIISQFTIDRSNKIVVLQVQNLKLILGITLNNINTLYTSYVTSKEMYDTQHSIPKNCIFFSSTKIYKIFLFIILLSFSSDAYATEFSELTKHIFFNNMFHWSLSTQILLLTFFVTLLSAFVLMTTSFTRIFIVLSLLRNALGIPSLPPNQLLISISLCLTGFIMYPTYHRVYQEAYLPFYTHNISINDFIMRFIKPIYDFMIHQTRQSDLLNFCKLSNIQLLPHQMIPMQVLLPAFITSELKTAFQIGFTIFIPFLIIDLFVTSILISLGMMMLSPNTISLPMKLILFVIVDGWQLIFSSLIHSFY